MSCPDRYVACPLKKPGDKQCKYLAGNQQARIQIRKDCLGAKGSGVEAGELNDVALPGLAGEEFSGAL